MLFYSSETVFHNHNDPERAYLCFPARKTVKVLISRLLIFHISRLISLKLTNSFLNCTSDITVKLGNV